MDIKKVLEQHEIWIYSNGESGEQADLSYANLRNSNLSYINLSDAKLRYADLRDANLREANLSDADLRYADLRGAQLSNADLSWTNLRVASLNNANFRNADMRCVDLRGADLREANLRDANLLAALLIEADLRNTDLRGANLLHANLRNVKLKDTYLPESTFIISDEKCFISICGDEVRVDLRVHSVSEWRQFTKQDIVNMFGKKSFKFYSHILDIIDSYCGKGERPKWLKK